MGRLLHYLGAFLCCLGLLVGTAPAAERPRVLVVMSYHEDMPWVREIAEGIASMLAGSCDLTWFHLDTRRAPGKSRDRGAEAYALFNRGGFAGVIAADDDAQSLFVVPYLRDRTKVPVVFCGVNAAPEVYGYPAGNVTGVLERAHVREAIALIQELDPTVRTVGFLMKDCPTARAIMEQVRGETGSYTAIPVAFEFPTTMAEAVAAAGRLRERCDALYLVALEGLAGEDGRPLTEREILPVVQRVFGKPTTTPDIFNVRHGILCAVSKTGQEQGSLAARMLLEAMRGRPLSEIPVTCNRFGRSVINATVLRELGIRPRPVVLRGAELVRTE